MITAVLHMWGKGAVTLPKKWRDKYDTKHFMAEVTPEGLLITPVVQSKKKER